MVTGLSNQGASLGTTDSNCGYGAGWHSCCPRNSYQAHHSSAVQGRRSDGCFYEGGQSGGGGAGGGGFWPVGRSCWRMFIPRRAGVCRRLDRVKGQAVSLMTKMEAWNSCPHTWILLSSRPTYGMSSPLAAVTDRQLVCWRGRPLKCSSN